MSPSPKKDKPKRKLQTRTVTEKLEIIEMRENGASWIKIAQDKGMNEASVRTIYRKKEEIRSQGMYF